MARNYQFKISKVTEWKTVSLGIEKVPCHRLIAILKVDKGMIASKCYFPIHRLASFCSFAPPPKKCALYSLVKWTS